MTIKTDKLGWPVAAALAGAMAVGALSGFQANTAPKFATVDMLKAVDTPSLSDANNTAIDAAKKTRVTVLEFISRNPAMDTNDMRKFAELSLKANPTPADTTEIARLRAAGETTTQARNALMTKAAPTDPEKAQMQEYASKVSTNRNLLQTLDAQYTQDVQTLAGDLRDKTITRVRDVVRGIAAKQGYTVVFDANAAPYAANDLTKEVSDALKK